MRPPDLSPSMDSGYFKQKVENFLKSWSNPYQQLEAEIQALESNPRALKAYPLDAKTLQHIEQAWVILSKLKASYREARDANSALDPKLQSPGNKGLLEHAGRLIQEKSAQLKKIEEITEVSAQTDELRKGVAVVFETVQKLSAGGSYDEWKQVLLEIEKRKWALSKFLGDPAEKNALAKTLKDLEDKARKELLRKGASSKAEEEKKKQLAELDAFLAMRREPSVWKRLIVDVDAELRGDPSLDTLNRRDAEIAKVLKDVDVFVKSYPRVIRLSEWANTEINAPLRRIQLLARTKIQAKKDADASKASSFEADFRRKYQAKLDAYEQYVIDTRRKVMEGRPVDRLNAYMVELNAAHANIVKILADAVAAPAFREKLKVKYRYPVETLQNIIADLLKKEADKAAALKVKAATPLAPATPDRSGAGKGKEFEKTFDPRNEFELYLVQRNFPREQLVGKTEKEIREFWELKRGFFLSQLIQTAVFKGNFANRKVEDVNELLSVGNKMIKAMELAGNAAANLNPIEENIVREISGKLIGDMFLLSGMTELYSEYFKVRGTSLEKIKEFFASSMGKDFGQVIKGLDGLPPMVVLDPRTGKLVVDEVSFGQRILGASREILTRGRPTKVNVKGETYLDRQSKIFWKTNANFIEVPWLSERGDHHELKTFSTIPTKAGSGVYPNDTGFGDQPAILRNAKEIATNQRPRKFDGLLPVGSESVFGEASFLYANQFLTAWNFEDAVQDNWLSHDKSGTNVHGLNKISQMLHNQEYLNKLFSGSTDIAALKAGASMMNPYTLGFIKRAFTGSLDLLSHHNRTAAEWIMDPKTTRWMSSGAEKGVFDNNIPDDFTNLFFTQAYRGTDMMNAMIDKGISFRKLVEFQLGEGYFPGTGQYDKIQALIRLVGYYHNDGDISVALMADQSKMNLKLGPKEKFETGQNIENRKVLLKELPLDVRVVDFLDEQGRPLHLLKDKNGKITAVPPGTPGAVNVSGQRNSLTMLFDHYEVQKEELVRWFSSNISGKTPILDSRWQVVNSDLNVLPTDDVVKNPGNYPSRFLKLNIYFDTKMMRDQDLVSMYNKELWQDTIKKYTSAHVLAAIAKNNQETKQMKSEDLIGLCCMLSAEFKDRVDKGYAQGKLAEIEHKLGQALKIRGLVREPGTIVPNDIFSFDQTFLFQHLIGYRLTLEETMHELSHLFSKTAGKGGGGGKH